ncbi:hypothetical protein L596_027002 [Steinernema carpocapsae]|nr:hypothetical protein L596_027002 [Steinernema carpocapsae]
MCFQRNKVFHLEIRLLLQSVIIFLYTAAQITLYDIAGKVFPESPHTLISLGIVHILNGGVNPLLYVTMNK